MFHLGFWPDGAGGRDLARDGPATPSTAPSSTSGPATALTERALALYGVADAIALLHEFTRRGGLGEAEQDRLAPVVLDAADAGDAVAQRDRRRQGPHPRRAGARLRGAARAAARRARGSSSPAASSRTRATRLADATMAELPGAVRRPPRRRRRSPARCCSRSTALGVAVDADAAAARGRPRLEGRSARWAGSALERVSKVFPGGVVAVDDVELEIGDGEFMVLVGPSGCGKSTLLRMIAGLEGVSGGTIRIGDREVTELAPRSRDIAMVFQNYALYPHMRVWDNLAFALKLRRTPKPAMREQVGSVAGVLGPEGAGRPQAGRAVGRPAPARRDRPRDGARAAGVPDGRAALEPRREAARRDARGARAAARPARHHDGLRHPRPGRGDDARRPRRGAARRHGAAVRHARAAVRRARRTCSSPRSWARRR